MRIFSNSALADSNGHIVFWNDDDLSFGELFHTIKASFKGLDKSRAHDWLQD